MPLAEKGDLLDGVTRTMREHGADVALAGYDVWDTTKWLVSSEGHRIDQHIVECGAQMDATAIGETETQRRSYPGIRGQYGTRGWELVRELDLPGNAARIAEEARALLTAPAVPEPRRDRPDHRLRADGAPDPRVGRPRRRARPDPRLGGRLRRHLVARPGADRQRSASVSELMNITADATLPGALGSFGYDDEGTPAHPVDIVHDGIWVGVLSGRDSAALAGLPDPAARSAATATTGCRWCA